MAFVYCSLLVSIAVPIIFHLCILPLQCTHVLIINSKSVVDPRRHNSQIPLLQSQSDPIVTLTPHVKVTRAIQDISNLLIFVKMFVEKDLYFFLVVWEGGGGDCDFVAVLVVARGCEFVYVVERGEVVADYAEFGEVGGGDWAAGVVGEALVALCGVVWLDGWMGVWWWEKSLPRCCRTSMPS